MAEVTNELIYRELLALDQKVAEVQSHLDENLALLRLIVREGEEGRVRIEATKARLGIDKLLRKAQFPQSFG
jgi:hypothetical protein